MKTNKQRVLSPEEYYEQRHTKGIYIHIPFCVSKCIYCDFASFPGCSEAVQHQYFQDLYREAELSGTAGPAGQMPSGAGAAPEVFVQPEAADSVFFGGGTPSCVKPEYLAGVLARISCTPDAEITLECNPADLTPQRLAAWRAMGINRLSMGVQSFQDRELSFLGRRHDSRTAVQAVQMARDAGFDNLNLDLIFGFPGQTEASWEATVRQALALAPAHLSFYSLQIEEGTPLYEMFRKEQVEQISDEENRRMYHRGIDLMKAQGYRHYEISNAALPGYECRHNLKYWTMAPYEGLGAAAHSFDGKLRYFNPSDLGAYTEAVRQKTERGSLSAGAQVETYSLQERMTDFIFTGLRLVQGMKLPVFAELFGQDFLQLYGQRTRTLIREGLLEQSGDYLRLTERGLDLSNYVMGELMEAI
ncbi:MAG: radical SAM family heme chaperone HemW [Anaerovoracaceae bacterium]